MHFTAGEIVAAFITSTIGFSVFLYGKKQRRVPQLVAGGALMAYPYFVGGALAVLAIGAGIIALLFLAIRAGL